MQNPVLPPAPTFPATMPNAELIAAIVGTTEYRALCSHFYPYPVKSQLAPQSRALMYAIIRCLRLKSVTEIGTLFAGTTEILARAVAANGEGLLTTIDPFGADRVPSILAGWPPELQRFVQFRPVFSMQYFAEVADANEGLDFVFIDGNHEYEFALYDLQCAARYLNPGGIIILDNYYDHGVRSAARQFEHDNPTWNVVRLTPHESLGTSYDAMLLDGLQRFYVAPTAVPIGQRPRGFNYINVEADGIRGLDLPLSGKSPGGRLYYKAYLRIFPWEFHLGKGENEEYSISGSIAVPSESVDASLGFHAPLATTRPLEGFHRRFEINLLFESDLPGQPLLLTDKPAPQYFGGRFGG